MGKFSDCLVEVSDGNGGFELRHRKSCVIQKLLDDGGLKKHSLQEAPAERFVYVAVGPWDDVPEDSPVQKYGLILLRDPHRFFLCRRGEARAFAEYAFGL